MIHCQNDPVSDYLDFHQVLYLLFLKYSHGNRYQADELQSQYPIDYCHRFKRDGRDDWIYSERSPKEETLFLTCLTVKNFMRSVPLIYSNVQLFLVTYGQSNFLANMNSFILETTAKNQFLFGKAFEEGFNKNGDFNKQHLFFSRVIETLISWDPSHNLGYIPNNPVNRATTLLKETLVKQGAYQKDTMRRKEVEALFNELFPPTTAVGRVFSKRQRDAVIESVLMWDPLNLDGANDE